MRTTPFATTAASAQFPATSCGAARPAANQVEGGYNADGQGLSIQDVMPHGIMTPPTDGPTPATQARGHRLLTTGTPRTSPCSPRWDFGVYRFSIAWSRIFPNGDDEKPNEEGLAFYDRVLTNSTSTASKRWSRSATTRRRCSSPTSTTGGPVAS